MQNLRTPKTQEAYDEYEKLRESDGCALCETQSLNEFEHWRVVENKFPYDSFAEVHHLVLPKRHVTEGELSREEADELRMLKIEAFTEYDLLLEPTVKNKSVPEHFHQHLIVGKD